MDGNGQALAGGGIPEVTFPATPGGPPGVEVLDVPALVACLTRLAADPYAPLRPAFHLLVTVTPGAGRLACSVDSTGCEVTDGGWLWVRPGQVLCLRPGAAETEGTAVLFQPGFLDAATVATAHVDEGAWPVPVTAAAGAGSGEGGGAAARVRETLGMLESEYRRLTDLPLEVHVEVVRHLLAVLVLRLSRLPGADQGRTAGGTAFRRFRQAVEEDFTRTRRVEDYAARLGYSVRTLTRATNAAVGYGAKRFIDDRVLLEAQRLLLHTGLPAGSVGERLGFPDATVFTKFFRQRAGRTPAAFRAHAEGTAPR